MATPVQEAVSQVYWTTTYTDSTGAGGQNGVGYPSGTTGATGGTAIPLAGNNRRNIGSSVHVRADMSTTAGTLSMTLALYGYCAENTTWYHLKDLGNGAAITVASQANSSSGATAMNWMERVDGIGGAYTRLYLRIVAVGGP